MLLRPASIALAVGLGLAAPVSAAPADNAPVAAEHVQTPAQPTPSATDSASYAQREHQAQNKQVEKYKGGDLVIIGASGGAILVLLLLLLILV